MTTTLSFPDIYRTVYGTDHQTGTSPDITLIYMSASWCPPCRQFTPLLKEAYHQWKEVQGKSIDIVFISSDRNEDQCDLYSSTMPWETLSYKERKLANQLKDETQARSIPTLLVFDHRGRLISKSGVQTVRSLGDQSLKRWTDLAATSSTV